MSFCTAIDQPTLLSWSFPRVIGFKFPCSLTRNTVHITMKDFYTTNTHLTNTFGEDCTIWTWEWREGQSVINLWFLTVDHCSHLLICWNLEYGVQYNQNINLFTQKFKKYILPTFWRAVCEREVVRFGSIIISYIWVSYRKPIVFRLVWCNICGEAMGYIWNWSLLGAKGLTLYSWEWSTSKFPCSLTRIWHHTVWRTWLFIA